MSSDRQKYFDKIVYNFIQEGILTKKNFKYKIYNISYCFNYDENISELNENEIIKYFTNKVRNIKCELRVARPMGSKPRFSYDPSEEFNREEKYYTKVHSFEYHNHSLKYLSGKVVQTYYHWEKELIPKELNIFLQEEFYMSWMHINFIKEERKKKYKGDCICEIQ